MVHQRRNFAMHHLLLFLPVLALILFYLLPWPIALPFYALILVCSIIGYWKALQAQRQPPAMGRRAMIGDRALVVKAEKGDLEVEYKGEFWNAVSSQPLQVGQMVIIEKVEGLILQVAPLPQPATQPHP
jgi:membrane protein implicated in regulation of membrane protease activity